MYKTHRTCFIFASASVWTIIYLLFALFDVMQWEFQVGPSVGIASGDELWAARYILEVM